MSNRNYTERFYTHEKYPVRIFCNLLGTGATAPTLQKWTGAALGTAGATGYRGVKSIARNGTGDYTITFQDKFNRLLGMSCSVLAVDGSTTPLVTQCWIKAVVPGATGGATVRLLFYLYNPATPADANTNEELYLTFDWSNSGVP
jgi:hypothetical protein